MVEPIDFLETAVSNYHYTPHNITEEHTFSFTLIFLVLHSAKPYPPFPPPLAVRLSIVAVNNR